MAILTIESPSRRYEVHTSQELAPGSSEVIDLLRFSEEVHVAVPIDHLSFERHEDTYKTEAAVKTRLGV